MPRATRWFVRIGLVYLVAALALGAWRAGPGGGAWLAATWPVYVHLLTVGWLTQLIFGVAYWMFPTPRAPSPWQPRLAWMALGLINAGLLLRVLVEPLAAGPGMAAAWLLPAGLLQLAGAVAMALVLWPRVRQR